MLAKEELLLITDFIVVIVLLTGLVMLFFVVYHNRKNRLLQENFETKQRSLLSAKEVEFLRLAATELTYREIADKMDRSPKTIEGYRESLFEKLQVRSRTGLVLFAIRKKLVRI